MKCKSNIEICGKFDEKLEICKFNDGDYKICPNYKYKKINNKIKYEILDVKDFLNEIEDSLHLELIDVLTTPTGALSFYNIQEYLKILDTCSYIAYLKMQNYNIKEKTKITYKLLYTRLQNSIIWEIGKFTLIKLMERILLTSSLAYYDFFGKNYNDFPTFSCYFCNKSFLGTDGEAQEYSINTRFVIHHIKYIKEQLFNPKYIRFACWKCHNKYHKKLKNKKGYNNISIL